MKIVDGFRGQTLNRTNRHDSLKRVFDNFFTSAKNLEMSNV